VQPRDGRVHNKEEKYSRQQQLAASSTCKKKPTRAKSQRALRKGKEDTCGESTMHPLHQGKMTEYPNLFDLFFGRV